MLHIHFLIYICKLQNYIFFQDTFFDTIKLWSCRSNIGGLQYIIDLPYSDLGKILRFNGNTRMMDVLSIVI